MKKLSFLLIILSFLFAAVALAIAIMGYVRPRALSTIPSPGAPSLTPSLGALDIEPAPAPEEISEPDLTPIPTTTQELGFTIEPPTSFGTFSLVMQPAGLTGSGTYIGTFSNESGIRYTVTNPEFIPGREMYYGDIQGYIKGNDGSYEIVLLGGNREPLSPDILVGEVELKDGAALVIKGKDYDGPYPYPSTPGQRLAIIGTPAGKVSAALFLAEPTVSAERFRSLLQTISVIDPQSLNN